MLKGQAKTDYQREYMRRYRSKQRGWRIRLQSPIVIKRVAVRPSQSVRPKMGFEPVSLGNHCILREIDADGNVIPED